MIGNFDLLFLYFKFLFQSIRSFYYIIKLIDPFRELFQLVLHQCPGLFLLTVVTDQADHKCNGGTDAGGNNRFHVLYSPFSDFRIKIRPSPVLLESLLFD